MLRVLQFSVYSIVVENSNFNSEGAYVYKCMQLLLEVSILLNHLHILTLGDIILILDINQSNKGENRTIYSIHISMK